MIDDDQIRQRELSSRMLRHARGPVSRRATGVFALAIIVIILASLFVLPKIAFGTDYTISSNTTWCDQSNVPSDIGNITINSSIVLTIGCKSGGTFESGGITLTATGTVTVNGTIRLVSENSTNSDGVGVTLNAANINVASGGTIEANGQGYGLSGIDGAGPGGGLGAPTGCCTGAGGGYGGVGAGGNGGVSATGGGAIYGSASAPTAPGSGGGCGVNNCAGNAGGFGGGAMRLDVTTTLTINGNITANGANGTSFGGGGSGGAIYITAGTLTGSASITANGGNGPSSGGRGGGGRIAVYYITNSSFGGFTTSTVNGGTVGNGTAGEGTAGFFQVTTLTNHATNVTRQLTVYKRYAYDAEDTSDSLATITVGASGASGATLDIYGGGSLTLSGALTITQSSTVIARGKNITAASGGAGVTFNVASATIDSGSTINANGRGYTQLSSSVNGAGPGGGTGSNNTCCTGGGGSHGGIGGIGNGSVAAAAGALYDDPYAPTDLGSGGGCGVNDCTGNRGGAGGGAVRLHVTGTLTQNGTITANASNGTSFGAGGSGGSIYVTADTLTGSGTFAANGGNGPSSGGKGGGGRVIVFYVTNSSFSGFTGSTVTAGTTGNGTAVDGTIGFCQVSSLTGHATSTSRQLTIYKRFAYHLQDSTDSLTAITVGASGATGASLDLAGGTTLTLSGALTITQSSSIIARGKNITAASGGTGLTLTAASVTIDSGSTINANGQGYTQLTSSLNGAGPGGGTGTTLNAGGGGASYGGSGSNGNGGAAAGTVNGSQGAPTDLGSGGGCGINSCTTQTGGAGGGAIRLDVTGTLTHNGTITANAGAAASAGGGGSGGSIYVTVNTLTGSGTFAANGGSSGSGSGGRGGGGRVAIYYVTNSSFTGFTGSTVTAGTTGNGTAVDGTVGFFQVPVLTGHATSTSRQLTIYKRYAYHNQDSTDTLTSITVGATGATGAILDLAGGTSLTLSGTLHVTQSSTITARAKNITAASGGVGITITAGNVTVDTGSTINANSQGYTQLTSSLNGAGPGGGTGSTNTGAGGGGAGHGGSGSAGNGGAAGGGTYDTITAPTDLGSGGGCGQNSCTNIGGQGGGAIRLIVSGTTTINGSLNANAGTITTSGGGASGGSIYVTTSIISGAGSFTANGGNSGGASGGRGGGGRTAVCYESRVSDTTTQSATAGTVGNGTAGAGTTASCTLPTATLSSPANGATGLSVVPTMQFSVSDYDTRSLKGRIQLKANGSSDCSAVDWTTGVTTFDQSSSQTGWSGQNANGNTEYSSGSTASHTVQDALSANTWYCWRAAAKASSGNYTDFGNDSTARSFQTGTAVLSNPAISLSTPVINTSNVTYTLTFSNVTISTIKCIKIQFTDILGQTNKPTSMNITSAAVSNSSNYVPTPSAWTVTNNNTTGIIQLTKTTGEIPASATSRTIVLTGITNGSVKETNYYAVVNTYNNTDCSSNIVNQDGITIFFFTEGVVVSVSVNPTLTFSVGSTTCNLGTLSVASVQTCSHTIAAASNAGGGYTLSYIPTTTLATSGGDTITAIGATKTTSVPGTEQFGFNLVGNTSPSVGANPSGGSGAAAAEYDTANQFAFTTAGATIGSTSGTSNTTTFTVSMIGNITATTDAGNYSTPVTYNITANY